MHESWNHSADCSASDRSAREAAALGMHDINVSELRGSKTREGRRPGELKQDHAHGSTATDVRRGRAA
jgi:hypothetical protein